MGGPSDSRAGRSSGSRERDLESRGPRQGDDRLEPAAGPIVRHRRTEPLELIGGHLPCRIRPPGRRRPPARSRPRSSPRPGLVRRLVPAEPDVPIRPEDPPRPTRARAPRAATPSALGPRSGTRSDWPPRRTWCSRPRAPRRTRAPRPAIRGTPSPPPSTRRSRSLVQRPQRAARLPSGSAPVHPLRRCCQPAGCIARWQVREKEVVLLA